MNILYKDLFLECDFICHKKCESRIFMKCSSKIESEALLQQDRTKESFDESMEISTEKVPVSAYWNRFFFIYCICRRQRMHLMALLLL